MNVVKRLVPALKALHEAIDAKALDWGDVIKIGRTHMQDATPITLGQEWSGYAVRRRTILECIEAVLPDVYRLALGVPPLVRASTRHPASPRRRRPRSHASRDCPSSAHRTASPYRAHMTRSVQLSGTFRTLAVSLYKIANDIRLMSCGPRAGFAELMIRKNEPGSSIMP